MSELKVQTFTVIAGTMACNAYCPDCVSKMTTPRDLYDIYNFEDVEWSNFQIAANLALAGGANTFLITGKGEPTLYPQQINDYLSFLQNEKYNQMAMKELQTNALNFHDDEFLKQGWLQRWYDNGLRVMCLSLVDVDDTPNKAFYCGNKHEYPPLAKTVEILHDLGYTVRASITMTKDVIDNPEDIERVVSVCNDLEIAQLSIRPVRKPAGDTNCPRIARWVEKNQLSDFQIETIRDYVAKNNDRVLDNMMHGAILYEFRGRNLCLTDCLTLDPNVKGFRQLIFSSNGRLVTDWTSQATMLMDMGPKCRAYLKNKKAQRQKRKK